ncbi:MAG: LytR C-terminal domain-containing protein [Actinomycetota bacterium]
MRVATDQIDEVPAIAPEPRGPRLGGTDVFRGSLVILTALVIGGFVITRGLDESSAEDTTAEAVADADAADDAAPAEATTTTAVVTTVPETTAPTVAETTAVAPEGPAVRAPSEVKVLVLNGAQTQGIAGRGTEVLQAASYQTGAPKNATTQRPSAIYYIEGYQAEALAVGETFGPGLETLVQPLDPADIPIDDTQAAHIIVVIGADQLLPIS